MGTVIIVLLAAWKTGLVSPSAGVPVSLGTRPVPAANYCDLTRDPSAYDGKEVRLKVLLRVGYEWQEIYCLDCFDTKQRTWIIFGPDAASCTSRRARKLINAREGTFAIQAVGEFQSSGLRYGHMGDYRYQFVIKCVEKAVRLLQDGRFPTLLPKGAFKSVCQRAP